ncbi:MarR family winged helix-turn-helix transcriptional regulator [Klenkia sp. LSe6-5]|uniref:MarR family winged helix-turn-helix transcriptional regulator n=1 Tax=Klenkia sesuvii TaxID=3103137 RepID=A0ABU8DRA9_9ACTN
MTGDPEADPYAELADLILNVGRLIRVRTPSGPEVVPLTPTERQVMRIVDLHPGSAPSEIAQRTHLQRTNVSTALRTLQGKGMVIREAGPGRGVAVHPTGRAVANLATLRSAWSRHLCDVLPGERDAVETCNRLLGRLEAGLTAPPTAGAQGDGHT